MPDTMAGMRLDRFLARWFDDLSRSWIARGIKEGDVRGADERPLRAAHRVRPGEELRLYLDGVAPTGPPPPFPPVLYEDARLVVIDKPPGLLAHPSGTLFRYGLIGLARLRYPEEPVELVHRLDRDTSGVLVLARDRDADRFLKGAMREGRCRKDYVAIVKGVVPWEERSLDGPIGPADGPVRVQMAVRDDGQSARTTVTVLARGPTLTRVGCRLHTGRTHQIRVHLHHAGHPVLGDRLYGTPPELFLGLRTHGPTDALIEAAGAPRQALHAHRIVFPHPDGHDVQVVAPVPDDMERWWADPSRLPFDRG